MSAGEGPPRPTRRVRQYRILGHFEKFADTTPETVFAVSRENRIRKWLDHLGTSQFQTGAANVSGVACHPVQRDDSLFACERENAEPRRTRIITKGLRRPTMCKVKTNPDTSETVFAVFPGGSTAK